MLTKFAFLSGSPDRERAGWAAVSEGAGHQAPGRHVGAAEEVWGQVQRAVVLSGEVQREEQRAGGAQNAAADRETQQQVKQVSSCCRNQMSQVFRFMNDLCESLQNLIQAWNVWGEEGVIWSHREDETGTGEYGHQAGGREEEICWASGAGFFFSSFILKLFDLYLLNWALHFTANLVFTGQYAAEVSSEANWGAGESRSSGATGTTEHVYRMMVQKL